MDLVGYLYEDNIGCMTEMRGIGVNSTYKSLRESELKFCSSHIQHKHIDLISEDCIDCTHNDVRWIRTESSAYCTA
jgi:hypothetical protein